MSCTTRFLNLDWEHHAWRRRVVATEQVSTPVTEMWGRQSTEENVRCHVNYVCDNCGATRDGEDCLCDQVKGDRCPARLEFLASRNAGQ